MMASDNYNLLMQGAMAEANAGQYRAQQIADVARHGEIGMSYSPAHWRTPGELASLPAGMREYAIEQARRGLIEAEWWREIRRSYPMREAAG